MRFIHFTDASNTDGILERGLIPKAYPRSREDQEEDLQLGVWNPWCLYADILCEDSQARYNGWLHVLWSHDQNLGGSDRTVGIVFGLAPEEVLYVGQWGHPIMLPEKDKLGLLSTTEDEEHAQQIRTTAGAFSEVLNTTTKRLRGILPGYQKGNYYDLVLGEWEDRYLYNKDRSAHSKEKLDALTKQFQYCWVGSGFEVCIPYAIPAGNIIGYRVFDSKDQLDEAWYKEDLFQDGDFLPAISEC